MDDSLESIREMEDGLHLLGNPAFEDGVIYQEGYESVKDRLEDNFRDYKRIIDDYIDLVHETWKYGFHESTFNFTCSCGYNQQDEMIVTNIAELEFSKEGVREQIKEEKWETQAVSTWMLRELSIRAKLRNPTEKFNMRKYFLERMDEELTEEKLDELWESEV